MPVINTLVGGGIPAEPLTDNGVAPAADASSAQVDQATAQAAAAMVLTALAIIWGLKVIGVGAGFSASVQGRLGGR